MIRSAVGSILTAVLCTGCAAQRAEAVDNRSAKNACRDNLISLQSIEIELDGGGLTPNDFLEWTEIHDYIYTDAEKDAIVKDIQAMERKRVNISLIRLHKSSERNHMDYIEESHRHACPIAGMLRDVRTAVENASGVPVSPNTIYALFVADLLPVIDSSGDIFPRAPQVVEPPSTSRSGVWKTMAMTGLVLGHQVMVTSKPIAGTATSSLRGCSDVLLKSIEAWCASQGVHKSLCGTNSMIDDTTLSASIRLAPRKASILFKVAQQRASPLVMEVVLYHSSVEDSLALQKQFDMKDLEARIETSMRCAH